MGFSEEDTPLLLTGCSIHPNVPQTHLQAVLLGHELEHGASHQPAAMLASHEEQQAKVCSSIGNSEKASGATGCPFV